MTVRFERGTRELALSGRARHGRRALLNMMNGGGEEREGCQRISIEYFREMLNVMLYEANRIGQAALPTVTSFAQRNSNAHCSASISNLEQQKYIASCATFYKIVYSTST